MQPEMLLNHTCSLEETLQVICVKTGQSNEVGISYMELQPHQRANLQQLF